MKTVNDRWTPEQGDFPELKSPEELTAFIEEEGFLSYFKCSVDGFSAEERVNAAGWWSDDPAIDPWIWRMVLAEGRRATYGKIFGGRAGFISREWLPVFASFRRDGYDFDSLYDDGLATLKDKRIMDCFAEGGEHFTFDLKREAGFGKGETGFETALTRLQMQTYLTVGRFERRKNKRGGEYGWHIAKYCTPESIFGEDYVRSGYQYERDEAFELLVGQVMKRHPDADEKTVRKLIAGQK